MVLGNIHTLHVRSNENLSVWESKRLKNEAKPDLLEGE